MRSKIEKQKAKRGVQVFLNYILEYKKEVTIIVILNCFFALLSGATPYISGKLFDSILSPSQIMVGGRAFPLWSAILTFWLISQVILRVIDWANNTRQSMFNQTLVANYTVNGANKLFFLPLSFHKGAKKGNVLERVNQAGNKLSSAMGVVFDIMPDFLNLVVGLFFVFWINYIFGFILTFSMVVFVAVVVKYIGLQQKNRKKAFKLSSEGFGNIYDALGNIKTVKETLSEDYEAKRFYDKIIGGSTLFWLKIIRVNANLGLFRRSLTLAIQFSIFLLSVYFIRSGNMTLGSLFAVNGYVSLAFGPMTSFLGRYNWLMDCFISLERAEKILTMKPEAYDPSSNIKMEDLSGDIEFQNVDFKYKDSKSQGGNDVLSGASFDIKQGETVAIVGESGVGKTTIADLISGFYFPQKGKILVDGVPTDKIPLHFLRKNIAVVSQDITIFNESIKYNIKYGNFGVSDDKVIEAAKEAGAHEFISKFKKKYNQKVGERGIKLSGGQRQRVAIAQAILKKSPILILDEPTSALDARTEKIVTESLEKLMEGRTTIIIAHRLSTVKKADKIIVLDKGKVVEIGKHNDLIKKKDGVYRKFYEVQKL